MSDGVCGNCGAPLDLDIEGRCRWCHARIQVRKARSATIPRSDTALVPDDLDDCFTSSPFLYLALAALGPGISHEPAIEQYVSERPVFLEKVRALATAASEAGTRARDAGKLRDDFDNGLAAYAPDEIWIFDLIIDIIAMLGALDGMAAKTRALIASDVRSLDQQVVTHTWKKGLKKAGDGPERFRELRATVPRHTPNPSR